MTRKHPHVMEVISHTTRLPCEQHPKRTDCNVFICGAFRPKVLVACQVPGCIKVEVYEPGPRDRKVPDGITPDQFQAMKQGTYWNEIALLIYPEFEDYY